MSKGLMNKLEEAIEEGRTYKRNWIYKIEDGIIAKGNPKQKAQNEYNIGLELFENGIHVPEFYEILEVESGLNYDLYDIRKPYGNHYIIMEELDGPEIRDLDVEDRKKAISSFTREIIEVLNLGIRPNDWGTDRNFIYDRGEEKTYLIDFESWVNVKEKDSRELLGPVLNELYGIILENKGT